MALFAYVLDLTPQAYIMEYTRDVHALPRIGLKSIVRRWRPVGGRRSDRRHHTVDRRVVGEFRWASVKRIQRIQKSGTSVTTELFHWVGAVGKARASSVWLLTSSTKFGVDKSIAQPSI